MKRLLARLAARELTHGELKQVSGGHRVTYDPTYCMEGPDAEGISYIYTCDQVASDQEIDT